MSSIRLAAVDLGASSGRVVLCEYDGQAIRLPQVHRFWNGPVRLGKHLKWPFHSLFRNVCDCIGRVSPVDSLAVDSWGVDFGLVDASGDLLLSPHHYRDDRTASVLSEMSEEKQFLWFARTGVAFFPFNTSLQLRALSNVQPWVYEGASALLLIPDLVAYFLSGEIATEQTIASTTQLLASDGAHWDETIVADVGVPRRLLSPVIPPRSVIGKLSRSAATETGLSTSVTIARIGGHDTASAVHGTALRTADAAFISSGTWSLLGAIQETPVLTREAMRMGFTNERAVTGNIRLATSMMGMWLVDQLIATWQGTPGQKIAYDALMSAAANCISQDQVIRLNDQRFYNPGNMSREISAYLRETGQTSENSLAGLTRIVLNSLALEYRRNVQALNQLIGKPIAEIHVVGGGSRNDLLNQLIADSCRLPVVAESPEAAALGNAIAQLESLREISGDAQRMDLIERSITRRVFEPREMDAADSLWRSFHSLPDRTVGRTQRVTGTHREG